MVSDAPVLDGIELLGRMNVEDSTQIEQIRYAIRQGHPQVWQCGPKYEQVAIVGSGPSLKSTERELVALIHDGVKVVALNGAYHWCLERNIKPSAVVVLDARESTARFVQPEIPGCIYYAASQCHQSVWDALAGRSNVGIFHAVGGDTDSKTKAILQAYYDGFWVGVPGGTTVATRAIGLLRTLGYLRFHLFGVDCCWLGEDHHAFAQPENEKDRRIAVTIAPTDDPADARVFYCAPWMLKQFEDFLMMIRHMGNTFKCAVHGDGLLAYALQQTAGIQYTTEEH